jgi:competence ComEA-like helix-hairpin-helix protein
MKHTLRLTLSLAAGALTVAVAVRAAPAAVTVQARQDAVLPDSPHTALFVRVCADCHDLERTVSRRRTRAEWAGTLDQMIEDGADATEEEMAAILDFLVSNFGAVAINSARAEDLTKVLGISSRDAEAIVAHRSANGSFANFEAVQKVPQIDVATLERRKASIRF